MAIYRGTGGFSNVTGTAEIEYVTEKSVEIQNAVAEVEQLAAEITSNTSAAQAAADTAVAASGGVQGFAAIASDKALEAQTSATSAATSANTATTQALAASTSATNAANSANAANTSALSAATSEFNAELSATTATTRASEASTSASNAASSASSASTSASTATTAATTATTKASEASASAAAAAQSAIDAAQFDPSSYYIKSETDTLLAAKQATLVSGTNIKTVNGASILGSGNITTPTTTVNNTLTSTSTTEALSAAQGKVLQDGKQATLVSGSNIKTLNGVSLLGGGDIVTNGQLSLSHLLSQSITGFSEGFFHASPSVAVGINFTTLNIFYSTVTDGVYTVSATNLLSTYLSALDGLKTVSFAKLSSTKIACMVYWATSTPAYRRSVFVIDVSNTSVISVSNVLTRVITAYPVNMANNCDNELIVAQNETSFFVVDRDNAAFNVSGFYLNGATLSNGTNLGAGGGTVYGVSTIFILNGYVYALCSNGSSSQTRYSCLITGNGTFSTVTTKTTQIGASTAAGLTSGKLIAHVGNGYVVFVQLTTSTSILIRLVKANDANTALIFEKTFNINDLSIASLSAVYSSVTYLPSQNVALVALAGASGTACYILDLSSLRLQAAYIPFFITSTSGGSNTRFVDVGDGKFIFNSAASFLISLELI